ncbi:MAG: hypothetical protein GF383_08235 [Candidatus Lokiarchaeota archaeon]|nr:hypothetical protein [Candidatus Lokiarchaeota archaeon]MBD3340339.1 hypothetical protein [Candidatus Lokiarchaeota archaeon]
MRDLEKTLRNLSKDLLRSKENLYSHIKSHNSSVHIYTHIDTDGLCSGAILGKALYREKIPFQISILKQLEKEEIVKIEKSYREFHNFLIFSDFGSGQYQDLQKTLKINEDNGSMIILDHHLPQSVANKEKVDQIEDIYRKTRLWHVNPYFYGADGSYEISGAGISYYFAKALNVKNIDLSAIAIVGAIGDIQNQGANKSFIGLNSAILEDAKKAGQIEVIDDLNFSSIKPLDQAIAYSSDIKLPGLNKDVNKSLKFLQTLGILMEKSDGSTKTLNDLNQDEKQKITSAIIEYGTIKLDIEPIEIIKKLIVNKYILKSEQKESELRDSNEFSSLLNACGRTNNGSLGIAIAMGDRKDSYEKAKEALQNYKKSLIEGLNWLKDEKKIRQKEHIQYFYGEDYISETIVGVIASMLVLDESPYIDINKPIFGYAHRKNKDVYKISARAHESIVKKGINLSEAIRKALELIGLNNLGGGHPPAAGTKIPKNKIELFIETVNEVISKQLNN